MTDQYTFRNPVTAYEQIEPPEQSQPEPGLDAELTPKADLGEDTYLGTGRLEGRKALITGADSGIGAATAIAFAREGADVVMSYLPEEEEDAARIANLIEKAGRKAVKVPGDLKDSSVCRALVETAVRELGGLDILVNNAGLGLLHSFAYNDIAEEKRHLKLHVETAMELTHAALQGMLERRSGRVINVASVAAFLPRETYSAAKAWLLSFSRWANLAYAGRGVKVTAVCPGFTHTEFHDRMGMDKTAAPAWMWLQAEQVVREGLADNEKGRAVSIPSKRYKLLTAAARVLPARLVAGPPRRAR